MRYFYGENAGRPILAGSKRYNFDIVGLSAGTAVGVVAVDGAEADVFFAAARPMGVTEITEAEHKAHLAKKKRTRSLTAAGAKGGQPARAPLEAAIKARAQGAVATPAGNPGTLRAGELPATAADAITLERISADAPASPDATRPTPPPKATKAQLKAAKLSAAVAGSVLTTDSSAEAALAGGEPAKIETVTL